MRHFILGSVVCTLLNWVAPASADTFNVAVAANFLSTAEQLGKKFETSSTHKASFSSSSTGKLYAQIKSAAPFDVFLSADVKTPELLEQEGLAVKGTRFSYAQGKLVLWSTKANFVDKQGKILEHADKFQHIAIANPSSAPYGLAAQQTLKSLKLWDGMQNKLARGESISQAMSFVSSGSTELGFVALSQIMDNDGKITSKGSSWIVPENLYAPMTQQAVLLKTGENNAAAKAFLAFLKTPVAQQIITAAGYGLP
ncbi:MAG: molybdate ABC transporter substrate-binding protein [Thiotrichaceae bacterium]|nr:molybdate ABC transporter substrate-binding protein [Thiotrichaceae bacterium]